jgi:hypothetical protein
MEVLYRLSYAGTQKPGLTGHCQQQNKKMERETRFELATLSLEG